VREKIKNIQELFKTASIYYSQKKNPSKREGPEAINVKELLNNESQVSNSANHSQIKIQKSPKHAALTRKATAYVERETISRENQRQSSHLDKQDEHLSSVELKKFFKEFDSFIKLKKKSNF
jgi:hypothetical protein